MDNVETLQSLRMAALSPQNGADVSSSRAPLAWKWLFALRRKSSNVARMFFTRTGSDTASKAALPGRRRNVAVSPIFLLTDLRGFCNITVSASVTQCDIQEKNMLGENDKNAIVDRLIQIVAAESATVQTKNGPIEDEVTADKNSLTAAKSLGGLYMKFLKSGTSGSCASHDAGTAGLCASDDGFKIGESFARCGTLDTGGVMLSVMDQNAILNRLIQILAKQTVTVQTKNGPVVDEVIADRNSIAAAKFMIGLEKKYQKHDKDDADIVRLNERDRKAIVERLMQIISKRSVIVQTKNGPVEDHVIADKNAMTSANLLMALHDQWLKCQPGTAGPCASDDGLKIEESLAGCETENAATAGLCSSDDGLKIGESLARCEPDVLPSDAHFAVRDVLQKAIRIGMAERMTLPTSRASTQ
jgi:hypothetical protein